MGLDVSVGVNNHEEVFTPEYESKDQKQHSLSRTFCNFICKRNAVDGEPELDQIGRLTGTDIASIYQMEEYSDDDSPAESCPNQYDRKGKSGKEVVSSDEISLDFTLYLNSSSVNLLLTLSVVIQI